MQFLYIMKKVKFLKNFYELPARTYIFVHTFGPALTCTYRNVNTLLYIHIYRDTI